MQFKQIVKLSFAGPKIFEKLLRQALWAHDEVIYLGIQIIPGKNFKFVFQHLIYDIL